MGSQRPEGGRKQGKPQSLTFWISQDKASGSTPLPLVPGCSCYKSKTLAVSRCYAGHTGCGWGPLEAGAREKRGGGEQSFKRQRPCPHLFWWGGRKRWQSQPRFREAFMGKTFLKSSNTFRPDLQPRGRPSSLTPKRLFCTRLCPPNAPILPHLQLPKGLEGENLDGSWKADARGVDQLKEEHPGY